MNVDNGPFGGHHVSEDSCPPNLLFKVHGSGKPEWVRLF